VDVNEATNSTFFTGLTLSGGAEQAMVSLSNYFSHSSRDWESKLVVLLKEKTTSSELEQFAADSVIRLNARRTVSSVFQVARIIAREKPSVIVSSLPHVSAVVSLARIFSWAKVNHVVRLESGFHDLPMQGASTRLKAAIVRKFVSMADRFIVVAEEMAPSLARVLVRRFEDFTFIPNPVVLPN